MLLAVYTLAVLVGATLVFLVQPIAAKLLLPQFGGSPAVWTTSLLFFQAALLAGYGWAHLSTTRLGFRRGPWVQVVLLLVPLLVLPIALPAWATPPTGVEPALWLLLVLAVMVGAPYVAVTTASPILQRWFSATDHPRAADPYFLYATGNAGSLFGLLAYPFLLEPNIGVADQARLWSVGYGLFVALSAAAAFLLRRHATDAGLAPVGGPEAPDRATVVHGRRGCRARVARVRTPDRSTPPDVDRPGVRAVQPDARRDDVHLG